MDQLWLALSNDPGKSADVESLERLFAKDAVVFGGHYRQDGTPSRKRWDAPSFIKLYAAPSDKGFYECEVARHVRTYDRFAIVESVVASRRDRSAVTPDFVGINSLQLYRADDGWEIISLYYHVENPEQAIPYDRTMLANCMAETRGP